MNRNTLLFAAFVLMLSSCASLSTTYVNNKSIEEIIETKMTVDDEYKLTMKWMNRTFVSSKDVIQSKDDNNGQITAKAKMSITVNTVPIVVNYTILIEFKENKIRLTFEALSYDLTIMNRTSTDTKFTYPIYNVFQNKVAELVSDYKLEVSNTKNEQW